MNACIDDLICIFFSAERALQASREARAAQEESSGDGCESEEVLVEPPVDPQVAEEGIFAGAEPARSSTHEEVEAAPLSGAPSPASLRALLAVRGSERSLRRTNRDRDRWKREGGSSFCSPAGKRQLR